MPVLKVWDAHRQTRSAVFCDPLTLAEVKRKGAAKLDYRYPSSLSLVLEEDGTEIDDDEVLNEYTKLCKVFLLLHPHEIWKSTMLPLILKSEESGMSCSTSPTLVAAAGLDLKPKHNIEKSLPGSGGESSDSARTRIEILLKTAPLPSFSRCVEEHILQPLGAAKVWSSLISEAAHYYHTSFPKFKASNCYSIIGSRMYSKYPSIGMEGKRPWTAFNLSLSQKLRHMRCSEKQKSLSVPLDHPVAKKTRMHTGTIPNTRKNLPLISPDHFSKEDIERHIEEIAKEWRKTARNKQLLKQLILSTRQDRKTLLEQKERGNYGFLFKHYPCFSECFYVFQAFVVEVGKKVAVDVCSNIDIFFQVVAQMIGQSDANGPSFYTHVIHHVENELKAKKSIIEEVQDVADGDLNKVLTTKEGEAPHTVLLFRGGKLDGCFIVGDTVVTRVSSESCPGDWVWRGIFILLASYYVFEIAYPPAFQGFLKLLQNFAFKENISGKVNKSLLFLASKIQGAWDKFESGEHCETCEEYG